MDFSPSDGIYITQYIMKIKSTFLAIGLGLYCMTSEVSASLPQEVRSYSLPISLEGVKIPVISLNGKWDLKLKAMNRWATVQVPGEVAMQGYAIRHDEPFTYRKTFKVPADFVGKRIILRFDGVYSHAQLIVNGKHVREHHGGFTRWETDITSWVRMGKQNTLCLVVTDRIDDISYASGYAHHPIGGILRNVTLFALPQAHLYNLRIDTKLDKEYHDATLEIGATLEGATKGELEITLKDEQGVNVALPQKRLPIKSGSNLWQLKVENPKKWDAEHPYLYQLEGIVRQNGKEVSRFSRHIGFRQIEVVKDKLLVNGRPVKLRGACRHDIHPTLGRTTTPQLDSLDVLLFKKSNMNFVRTSHYPPSETFLEYCDRYGIYVECETAVCFVDTWRQKNYYPGASQDDKSFADRYQGQLHEMVKSLRTHVSIIMWSIGNESEYGKNFQASWDWMKANDPTRPVIFSYPGSKSQKDAKIYDILSMHYQDVYGNLWQRGMQTNGFQGHEKPVLFDEWAHPACYTYATLQTDPNIREFWSRSIDMMWSGLFDAPGGLGGAIWGYIDELFMLPNPKVGTPFWKEFAHTAKPEGFRGNCVGYGEWGIVDVWRREKPEFWATKKAYSPIRLLTSNNLSYTNGQPIRIHIHNRYDHTNLNEIDATYTYRGKKNKITMLDIPPHQKGLLILPGDAWEEGEQVKIEFTDDKGELIDICLLTLGQKKIQLPATMNGKNLRLENRKKELVIVGQGFEFPFDKTTGLITNAKVGNEVVIEKGPFINLEINLNHLTGAEVRKRANSYKVNETDWKMKRFSHRQQGDKVYVTLSGTYKEMDVQFNIIITAQGELSVDYWTKGTPNGYLREAGLAFHLPQSVNKLTWKRKGYWNYYPEGSFAGNNGACELYVSVPMKYGEYPDQPWQTDTHNFYYWADKGANCKKPLTQMAKGMKENIYYYTLTNSNNAAQRYCLSVITPDASVACRINKTNTEQLILFANNRWDYPEIAWGNYCKTIEALPCYGRIDIRINTN